MRATRYQQQAADRVGPVSGITTGSVYGTIAAMSILAIDYGLVRFGIAIAEHSLASGVGTFTVKTNQAKLALIQNLLAQYQPEIILIGKTGGNLDQKVDAFIQNMKQFYQGQIVVVDETMSTRQAFANATAAGMNRKKRQANIDTFAAQVLLQEYIDGQKT